NRVAAEVPGVFILTSRFRFPIPVTAADAEHQVHPVEVVLEIDSRREDVVPLTAIVVAGRATATEATSRAGESAVGVFAATIRRPRCGEREAAEIRAEVNDLRRVAREAMDRGVGLRECAAAAEVVGELEIRRVNAEDVRCGRDDISKLLVGVVVIAETN